MYIGCTLPSPPAITTLYTAFQAERPADFYFSGEAHDFAEIVYITKGRAEITANERVFYLEQGQLVLHPPLEFHRIRNAQDEPLGIMVFSFSTNEPECPSLVLTPNSAFVQRMQTLLSLIDETFCFENVHVISVLPNMEMQAKYIQNELQSIFLNILSSTPATPSIQTSKKAKDYALILQTFKQNLSHSGSTDDFAKLCKMSPSTLKKIVHEYSGMGVMALFHKIKLQLACNLLRENKSVQEVSIQLGFENPNYFCTFFKRKFGISPTKWRQNYFLSTKKTRV